MIDTIVASLYNDNIFYTTQCLTTMEVFMKNISIMTDGSCDIPVEVIQKYNIKIIPLHFQFEDHIEYGSVRTMDSKEFYRRIEDGEIAKTSAASPLSAMELLKEELEQGNDIICIALSSSLSCTFNNIRMASLELER